MKRKTTTPEIQEYENSGRVSKRKRAGLFQHLTDEDIALAENIYADLHAPEEPESEVTLGRPQ